MRARCVLYALGCGISAICLMGAIDHVYAQAANDGLSVQRMHEHPWFWTVMLGSAGGWVIGYTKGFKTAADWVRGYYPRAPGWVVIFADAVVFLGFGTYLGTGIYNPSNFVGAIFAGGTWPIAVGALVKDGKGSGGGDADEATNAAAGAGATEDPDATDRSGR